ncbi:Flavoprotein [Penicillium cf. griseofulvum]|uniref:Flavoprotein n=1 Tax=Penicillium cf. griseofulvum TaxID=2972120 RepID=A0A9W9JAY4_9EURO|nr:Flavoprotein [Penicillium cf. griseofulvum]KAJ5444972.1 Flavoprotein [Penicillium cf. griseofulvum]KAJ5446686.1 Flavoprotein [Penicillium cf. griseofulvum]
MDSMSTSFTAQQYTNDKKVHVLLAAATNKLPNIAEALCRNKNISVRILVTEPEKFLIGQSSEQSSFDTLLQIDGVDGIYRDEDEWSPSWTRGGPVLHIELRKWAHILLVAPMSANTMAKMTNGIADNLLLSVIRAWDTTGVVDMRFKAQKPMVFAALDMDACMYRHPVTEKQLKVLRDEWGWSELNPKGWVTMLPPIEKSLAHGDVDTGNMMDWRDIVTVIQNYVAGLAQKP